MGFTPTELQKLVLMTGSKKGLGTYLGLDPKETDRIWNSNQLKTPLSWLKDQDESERLRLLGKAGSLKALAKRIGCSEAALRPIYLGDPVKMLPWSQTTLLEQLERYGSVRTVAHMNDVTESQVRRLAEACGLDLTDLIDYSANGHANGKGRRAELEFARLRGAHVLADLNKTEGSQAEYDFLDRELGRVNVKSSRQWRYRAQSRQGNPDFWKASNRGWQNADHLVILCYDRKMEQLVGVCKVNTQTNPCDKTILLTRDQLESPDALSVGGES